MTLIGPAVHRRDKRLLHVDGAVFVPTNTQFAVGTTINGVPLTGLASPLRRGCRTHLLVQFGTTAGILSSLGFAATGRDSLMPFTVRVEVVLLCEERQRRVVPAAFLFTHVDAAVSVPAGLTLTHIPGASIQRTNVNPFTCGGPTRFAWLRVQTAINSVKINFSEATIPRPIRVVYTKHFPTGARARSPSSIPFVKPGEGVAQPVSRLRTRTIRGDIRFGEVHAVAFCPCSLNRLLPFVAGFFPDTATHIIRSDLAKFVVLIPVRVTNESAFRILTARPVVDSTAPLRSD